MVFNSILQGQHKFIVQKIYKISFFTILYVLATLVGNAQSLSGTVVDEKGQAVPYANIFVKELQSGTSADFDGKFFLSLVSAGEYSVVISALGYESKNVSAILREPIDFKIYATLSTSAVLMNEIIVKAEKKDPAYAIIRKVIESKEKYLQQVDSYQSEIYLKSIEKLNLSQKTETFEEEKTVNKDGSPIDPLEEKQRKLEAEMNKINMVEMQLTMHHQKPNSYKETRNAFTVYGRKESLFVPILSEINFSFYRNLVKLKGISDTPIISPISNTSILSYKYKLLESTVEDNGQLVYKIKVIPRKKGNATVKGIIYINEGLWNIRSLDVELNKGSVKFYDQFRIRQNYNMLDSVWMIERQEFDYETKVGGKKNFVGNTLITVQAFEKNVQYPSKFFGNEISVLTKEATERDSSYWLASRPEPLTQEQNKLVKYQDSIQAVLTSDVYLDSIQAEYNKIEFLDLVWNGVGFRDHKKKSHIWIGPLPSMLDFKVVGGWRVGPYASYFRRFESGRMVRTSLRATMGLKNNDVQGSYSYWMRYAPRKLADFRIATGRTFDSINDDDAYLNQLRSANYILNDFLDLRHQIELVNGLFLHTRTSYNNRQSARQFNTSTFINEIIEDIPSLEFEPYKAMITSLGLSYTPQQRYMTEPNRKIILGSKYPTFHLKYFKGWKGVFESNIDFDRLELEIEQDLVLGIFGNTKYNVKMGQFVNSKDVKFVDLKRFRQSDPILYSDPLSSFQLLDTALAIVDYFFEVHHIHHFNGALVNNIPLVKKLRIQAVVGGGFLWIPDANVQHQEIFAGIERTFKLGARRRLRIGVYGVLADSNFDTPDSTFKISFDVIDTWSRDWSF